MGRSLGIIGVLLAAAIGGYIYTRQAQSVAPGSAVNNPRATVDVVAVRNDLLSIANAERRHFASEGKYVSIDDLVSVGDIPGKSRGPYTYDVDVQATGFKATASYGGPGEPGIPHTLSVDESMQVRSE